MLLYNFYSLNGKSNIFIVTIKLFLIEFDKKVFNQYKQLRHSSF